MEKKLLRIFLDVCSQARNAARLLKGSPDAMGHRIFPPRLAKHDERLGYRVDQGVWKKDGTFAIVIQRNGQPHGDTIAATIVDPGVDKGDDVVDRLRKDAEDRGNL
jgi:hypothetical protein